MHTLNYKRYIHLILCIFSNWAESLNKVDKLSDRPSNTPKSNLYMMCYCCKWGNLGYNMSKPNNSNFQFVIHNHWYTEHSYLNNKFGSGELLMNTFHRSHSPTHILNNIQYIIVHSLFDSWGYFYSICLNRENTQRHITCNPYNCCNHNNFESLIRKRNST